MSSAGSYIKTYSLRYSYRGELFIALCCLYDNTDPGRSYQGSCTLCSLCLDPSILVLGNCKCVPFLRFCL